MDDLDIQCSLRLDAVAENLGLGRRWRGPDYVPAAIEACIEKVRKSIDLGSLTLCEEVAEAIAGTQQVRFEEVRTDQDLVALEDRYLRQQKEIEFGLLRDELADPNVEALLIKRRKAGDEDPDRWVAVLNSLRTPDRAFWNKFHELSHRLAEPAQLILPLGGVRREIVARPNTLEKLIDRIAAEIAFMPEIVGPHLSRLVQSEVTVDNVSRFRDLVAPTASLLSSMNAFIARHPRVVLAFQAEFRMKYDGSADSADLRIRPQGRSVAAVNEGFAFMMNMRVPHTSCVWATHIDGVSRSERESMASWTTSKGSKLKWDSAIVSSTRIGMVIYGTIEVL